MANLVSKVIFKFKEFSRKQKMILHWWKQDSPHKDKDGIIADGAVRSGKTVSMSLSYVNWSMACFKGQNFIICGKTIGSLRRNVITPLKVMLWTRGYKVIDRRSDNYLEIRKNGRVNFYYLFGGKDESSQDLIQGITAAGAFFDEVALMPQSFVNQATARCSVDGSKLWFNCNPDGAYHWFKLEWIDKVGEKYLFYLHFTMDDNPSLTDAVRERYRRMYAGIFFKRYILGLWVLAEGVIYDMFSEEKHVRNMKEVQFDYWDYCYVACDYGTQNPCTYGLYRVKGKHVHLDKTYYYDGRKTGVQKSDSEYAEDMVKWLGNEDPKFIIVDPSAASFITELQKSKYHLPDIIKAKNNVLDGIRFFMRYLQEGLFSMEDECIEDKREFQSYLWDEKAGKAGKEQPLKENDHCMDRNRYATFTVFGGNMDLQYADKVYQKGKVTNPKNIYHKLSKKPF